MEKTLLLWGPFNKTEYQIDHHGWLRCWYSLADGSDGGVDDHDDDRDDDCGYDDDHDDDCDHHNDDNCDVDHVDCDDFEDDHDVDHDDVEGDHVDCDDHNDEDYDDCDDDRDDEIDDFNSLSHSFSKFLSKINRQLTERSLRKRYSKSSASLFREICVTIL